MPKDYESFCKVAAHLLKNAHRYQKKDGEVVLIDDSSELKIEQISDGPVSSEDSEFMKKIWEEMKKEENSTACKEKKKIQSESSQKVKKQLFANEVDDSSELGREVNKQLHEIQILKRQNRI